MKPLRPIDPDPPPCPECHCAPGHDDACALGNFERTGGDAGLTDRERACLRGEHEAARFEDAYCMSYSAMPIERGFASWLLRVCAHCRAVFVARSP